MPRVIAGCVSVTVLAGFLWTTPAGAQRLDGMRGQTLTMGRSVRPSHPIATPPGAMRPGPPRHGVHPPHGGFAKPGFAGHGRILRAPFYGYGPYAYGGYAYSSPVYAEPPAYAYPAPASSYPPAYASPPATWLDVAPAPPMPTVIEYSTGRYELRGDGVTTAYRWVWVPNPPSTPPPPPPTVTPEPPPAAAPAEPSARRSTLYRWTDRDGVAHWTDNPSTVPKEYRAKVETR